MQALRKSPATNVIRFPQRAGLRWVFLVYERTFAGDECRQPRRRRLPADHARRIPTGLVSTRRFCSNQAPAAFYQPLEVSSRLTAFRRLDPKRSRTRASAENQKATPDDEHRYSFPARRASERTELPAARGKGNISGSPRPLTCSRLPTRLTAHPLNRSIETLLYSRYNSPSYPPTE